MATPASQSTASRLISIVCVGVVLCAIAYFARSHLADSAESIKPPRLSMGGSSSAFFMMDQWQSSYFKEKGIKVDFESTGSTKGIGAMIERKFLIGFTHAALSPEQEADARSKGGEVFHIPVILCAVVPIYNVKELADQPPLKFTGPVLADIFLGKITRWNDPALMKLNEGVKLPETMISVVHRSDSSGTTAIFTDYLHDASEAWRKQVGEARAEVKWPIGVGKQRSSGVVEHVAETDGAIGYVDLLNAEAAQIAYGAMQNKDQTAFIHAEPASISAAAKASNAEIPDNLAFDLINKPGKDSYPISGAVWAVCYRKQPAAQRQMVADFLHWVTHDGQTFAEDRTYAPLSPELVARVEQKLALLRSD